MTHPDPLEPAPPVQRIRHALPHGVTLGCRVAGAPGRPLLVFLHGFPEAAFVWDDLLAHFAHPDHGAWRCVAPNLRGYADSSAPPDVRDYRPKALVEDIAALIALEGGGQPAAALVAHDWGGALAWNLANQQPDLLERLVILNSPHPGALVRELQRNPAQQAASTYMHALTAPDAPARLAANGYAGLWPFFFEGPARATPPAWLTATGRLRYHAVWDGPAGSPPGAGLRGPCHYYSASPLRPPTLQDPGAAAVQLPDAMLTITVPTLVLWGTADHALLPGLLDGLDHWVPRLQLVRAEGASHWLLHEQPDWVMRQLAGFLLQNT